MHRTCPKSTERTPPTAYFTNSPLRSTKTSHFKLPDTHEINRLPLVQQPAILKSVQIINKKNQGEKQIQSTNPYPSSQIRTWFESHQVSRLAKSGFFFNINFVFILNYPECYELSSLPLCTIYIFLVCFFTKAYIWLKLWASLFLYTISDSCTSTTN